MQLWLWVNPVSLVLGTLFSRSAMLALNAVEGGIVEREPPGRLRPGYGAALDKSV